MKNLITAFLLILLVFHASGQENIQSFETYCKSIKSGAEVEVLEITWPGDDLLCDDYEGSDGYFRYEVYRLQSSKRIVMVTESGNYCQGDSDYSSMYLFDKNGFAVYSVKWDYMGTSIQFYASGKPIVQVDYPGEGSLEEDFPHKIAKLDSTKEKPVTSLEFEQAIEQHRETMRNRIEVLKKLSFESDEAEKKAEADTLITQLKASLFYSSKYITTAFSYRKAYGDVHEMTLVNSTDIRVRSEPSSTARVIAKVSYYNGEMEVIEKGPEETIEPFGNHAWYKISFVNSATGFAEKGWIFGAFLAEGIFFTP